MSGAGGDVESQPLGASTEANDEGYGTTSITPSTPKYDREHQQTHAPVLERYAERDRSEDHRASHILNKI